MSDSKPRKNYTLYALAIALFVAGALATILAAHNFALRAYGFAGVMAAIGLARMSNVHSGRPRLPGQPAPINLGKPKTYEWMIGLALLAVLGAAFVALLDDARHGYQAVMPVYFFTGAALVNTVYWPYLITKFTQAL